LGRPHDVSRTPHTRGRLRSAALAVVAAVGLVAATVRTVPGSTATSFAVATTADRVLGPTAPGAQVRFSLALRVPHRAARDRFLASLGEPSSPNYRRFVSAAAIGEQFGLPQATIRDVAARLHAAGLEVVTTFAQRTTLGVVGPASAVERTFGVALVDRVDGRGRRYHEPVGPPSIPPDLRNAVTGVLGLSDRPFAAPMDIPFHDQTYGMHPDDLAKAYDIDQLWSQGVQGQGQAVAVVSLASYQDADIRRYDALFHLQTTPVHRVVVSKNDRLDTEVALDLETIRAVAPRATLYDYEAENTFNGMYQAFNRIFSDGKAKVVSLSWGLCEALVDAQTRSALAGVVAMEAQDGITIFTASADQGAYDCVNRDAADHHLRVDFPSDNPNVVAVGGTRLEVRTDGSYFREWAWENVITRWGGGGGITTFYERPDWQQGPGVDRPESNGFRQLPDVAGDAASSTGIYIVGHQTEDDGSVSVADGAVGGTSAAAPFWAGMTVLLRQYVEQQGGTWPGYLNPVLYGLASQTQPFPPFHDVTLGRNLHFHAGPGWDFATGLGSPDAYNLARDILASAASSPA
jgi:subtilase family serine protease